MGYWLMQEWSKNEVISTRKVPEKEWEEFERYCREGNLEELRKGMSPYFTFGRRKGNPIRYVNEEGRDITMMVLSLKAAGLRRGVKNQDYEEDMIKDAKNELFKIGKRTRKIFESIEDFSE